MLSRRVYTFPVPEIDGMAAVNEKYLELKRRYRDEQLDEEELDYMDYANNVLATVE